MRTVIRRLLQEETGQDLVEYALLTSLIGFASAGVFPYIMNAIGNVYLTWETSVNGLWEPGDPLGSGS